ncbi:hypothetical protein ACFQET_01345 [Levilactobacillus tangyuanensis]|uniref:Uncharacterized protein n=1 Tax=Levilactobacillus tangyuanensis TaxID=2486021 RepID=A0ABW1TKM7_9LACO|nr:hypothetical protein [Levilactobacillus tangyuanensis]
MKKISGIGLILISMISMTGALTITSQASKRQHSVPKVLRGRWDYNWKLSGIPSTYVYLGKKDFRIGMSKYRISYITGSKNRGYNVHLKRKFVGSKLLTFKYKLRNIGQYGDVKSITLSTNRYTTPDAMYIKGDLERYHFSNFVRLDKVPDSFDTTISGYTKPNSQVSISGNDEADTIADKKGHFVIDVVGNIDDYSDGNGRITIWTEGPKSSRPFKKSFIMTASVE